MLTWVYLIAARGVAGAIDRSRRIAAADNVRVVRGPVSGVVLHRGISRPAAIRDVVVVRRSGRTVGARAICGRWAW